MPVTDPLSMESATWAAHPVRDRTEQSRVILEAGRAVIPFLPPLLQGDSPNYHHHLQVRPLQGCDRASVTFNRYAWASAEVGADWQLVELEPLTVSATRPTPFLVVGPLKLNPECPQAWTISDARSAAVSIGAIPRQPDLPALQLMPGITPPITDQPHTMILPPRVELPDIRRIVPCRLEVFPISPFVSIAVRLRISEHGQPVGETPYLFRSTLSSPKAWEIRNGRRILEEDPNTGQLTELVEATPEAGHVAPAITVFSGRVLATFTWRTSHDSSAFSVAGMVPGEISFTDRPASGHDRYFG